jgi:hypothetical protein
MIATEMKLPPLILHPFSDPKGADKLVESSRASLMIQGLLPSGARTPEELEQAVLDGRFCEIRMLFYVGKDLLRWIEQCLEHIERSESLRNSGIRYQSFAAMLVQDAPPHVQSKLRKWGVADYKSIFTRALGLNAIFSEVPDRHGVSDEFIRSYYRYADAMFSTRQQQSTFADITNFGFEFDIYASGEYSRMLEKQWESLDPLV